MTPSRLRPVFLAAVASCVFAAAGPASASPQATARDEIDHLLQYVAASSCTFVRNGTEYPAAEARDHLATKYRFVGSRIATAEDFIKYLATGSSMSGEPYHVRCGQTDEFSGKWLTAELNRYRKQPHLQRVAH
ncbi:MAG: DUF5329 family protein [Rudaea sp.]